MIKLDDEYGISVDKGSRCYQVGRIGIDKETGEEVVRGEWYYVTLAQALEGYMRKTQRTYIKENNVSLKQAIAELKKMREDFEKMLRSITEEELCD